MWETGWCQINRCSQANLVDLTQFSTNFTSTDNTLILPPPTRTEGLISFEPEPICRDFVKRQQTVAIAIGGAT